MIGGATVLRTVLVGLACSVANFVGTADAEIDRLVALGNLLHALHETVPHLFRMGCCFRAVIVVLC
jgi:hypothetical protein